MKRLIIYGKLECKKAFQQLPPLLLGSILILLFIAGILGVLSIRSNDTETSSQIQIGVVAAEQEPYLDWMIQTIENMDRLEFTCEFHKLSEEKAKKQLENGTLDVVFIVPNQYVDSLIQGREAPLIIRFGKGDTTIASFLIRQIGEAASTFMTNTQAGIYTMNEFYAEQELPNQETDELALNLRYLDTIAGRNGLIQVEEVTQAFTLSETEHYATAAVVLLLLLWGMTCPALLRTENIAFQNALRRCGIGTIWQTLIHGFSLVTVFSCCYLLLAFISTVALAFSNSIVPGMIPDSTLDWLGCFVKIIPTILPACALLLLIYDIIPDSIGGVMLLFLSILILGYLSGCFFPLSMLPQSIQRIAPILPLRVMYEYVSSCFTGHEELMALGNLLLNTTILLGISLILKGIRKGGQA